MMPQRIQLSRARGWRMPADTLKVDRTTRWGNPYRVGALDAAQAVQQFRADLETHRAILRPAPAAPVTLAEIRAELAGKNLACWCRPGQPCHADVLLEFANTAPGVATSYTITLPLPDHRLSPNHQVASKGGRLGKARQTKTYRQTAAFATLAATACARPRWEKATAQVTWYAPDARRRDKDNCQASLKAAFDGLTDAGLLTDDSGLTHLPLSIAIDRTNPRVEITISLSA